MTWTSLWGPIHWLGFFFCFLFILKETKYPDQKGREGAGDVDVRCQSLDL